MTRRTAGRGLAALLAIGLALPAVAIGLGPLTLNGVIDGPREGFQLDVFNPYADSTEFVAYAVGIDDETPQPRVTVFPAEWALGGQRGRKLLIIADELAVGESYRFRVCAQRKSPPEGIEVNARVCSKITAHRIG